MVALDLTLELKKNTLHFKISITETRLCVRQTPPPHVYLLNITRDCSFIWGLNSVLNPHLNLLLSQIWRRNVTRVGVKTSLYVCLLHQTVKCSVVSSTATIKTLKTSCFSFAVIMIVVLSFISNQNLTFTRIYECRTSRKLIHKTKKSLALSYFCWKFLKLKQKP